MKTEIMEVCNQEMKKKEGKNKGFSLVELIVVIAIMAILAIVIAPQVMKYIGKSKDSVDNTNMTLYKSAATTTLANEDIFNEVVKAAGTNGAGATGANVVVKISDPGTGVDVTSASSITDFIKDFKDTLVDGLKLPQAPGKDYFEITINVKDSKIGKITVEAKKTVTP